MATQSEETPIIFISHGAGPCWFVDGKVNPSFIFKEMDINSESAAFMRSLQTKAKLPKKPLAILVVSAHWEETKHTVMTSPNPDLYFDYYGFPDETYKIQWPAPGAPDVARRAKELLGAKGIECLEDSKRGLDHGVFVPLKLAYPEAGIPVCQLSLKSNLDVNDHLLLGEALRPLSKEGVLIIGSGQSTHNSELTLDWCRRFKDWFHDVMTNPSYTPEERKTKILAAAKNEPSFSKAHERIEHYLPAVVALAAAEYRAGSLVYEQIVMDRMLLSCVRFD